MDKKCNKHPTYKAIRKPTADCQTCRDIYGEQQQEDLTRIREVMDSLSFDLKIEKNGEVDLALVEIYKVVHKE